LPFAVGLSRQAAGIIKQNLAISMVVIALLVVATLGGWAGIGTAVLLHEGSTMVVVVNSLRLLTYTRR
jgi:Cd2+/Zn2+-exporting ATPase